MAEVKSNFTTIEEYINDAAYINAKKALDDADKSNIMNIIQAKIVLYNAMMTYLFGCAVVQRTLEWIQAVLVPVGFSTAELEKLPQFPGKVETATPAKPPAKTPAKTPAAATPTATPRREPETPRREPETPKREPETPVDAPVVANIPNELKCIRALQSHITQKNTNLISETLRQYNFTWKHIIKYLSSSYMRQLNNDNYNEFEKILARLYFDDHPIDYSVTNLLIPVMVCFYNFVDMGTAPPMTTIHNLMKTSSISLAYGMRISEFNWRNSDESYIKKFIKIERNGSNVIVTKFLDDCYIAGGVLYKSDGSRVISNTNTNNLVISLYMANMHIFNSANKLFSMQSPLVLYNKISQIDMLNNITTDNYKSVTDKISEVIKINITNRLFIENAAEVQYTTTNQNNIYMETTNVTCTLFMLVDNARMMLFPHVMNKEAFLLKLNFDGTSHFSTFTPLIQTSIRFRVAIYNFLNNYKST